MKMHSKSYYEIKRGQKGTVFSFPSLYFKYLLFSSKKKTKKGWDGKEQ